MHDPRFAVPEDFTEAYEVVRTLELHTEARKHYRIEIVRVLRGSKGHYQAHYTENVQGIWIELLQVAWVAADDQDTATHQALARLGAYSHAPAPRLKE